MAWTELTRRQHERKGSKYASDTTALPSYFHLAECRLIQAAQEVISRA